MDPIADMLTCIRNAQMVGHKTVIVPFSKVKREMLSIFKKEGFIKDFREIKQKDLPFLKIYLKYKDKKPVIHGLKRISKPGRRVYVSASKIPVVLGGLGVAIISTSSGIMTDKEARKKKIGGEILCEIW